MLRLDRTHLSLLAALRRQGTLTAAAESLHITQAAASQRLREAERRLGIDLVARQGRTVALTPAGERLALAGDEVDRSLRLAEADAVWMGRRGARLRLAMNHHDGPRIYDALRAAAAVDLEVLRCRGDEPAVLVKRGEADLAVLPAAPVLSGVEGSEIATDRLTGIVPSGHALAVKAALGPEDFATDPYLTYGLFPQAGWEYERFFRAGRCFPGRIVMIESTALIAERVARGDGLSILPTLSIPQDSRVRLIPLAGEPMTLSWTVISAPAAAEDVAAFLPTLRRAMACDR